MRLTAMRYKDYVWPHNPRTYSIEYGRDVRERKVPYGWYHLQEMGQRGRVMKGEGEFVGADAYAQFRKLANVYYQGGPGLLVHPVWMAANVIFAQLKLLQEPRADYVRYSFTFVECFDGYDGQLGTEHRPPVQSETGGIQSGQTVEGTWVTVRRGDTLWGIARQNGVELTALIRLNPQIKNPNLILVGEKVRVA